MMKFITLSYASLFLSILQCLFIPEQAGSQPLRTDVPKSQTISNPSRFSPSNKELEFIQNKGQLSDQDGMPMSQVLYISDSKGMKCYLTPHSMHFVFNKLSHLASQKNEKNLLPIKEDHSSDTLILQRMDLEFVSANPIPRIEATDITDGFLNYFLNGKRITGVRGYKKVIYHDLYPYIDMVIYSTGSTMKYDFIVHPGGDPKQIGMKYSGADSMNVDAKGNFTAFATYGALEEDKPYCYQTFGEQQQEITSYFYLIKNNLHFKLSNFDHSKDLVIDPSRQWATYYGGSGSEFESCIAIDDTNNVLIGGATGSNANISTTGSYQTNLSGGYDNFIVKFNSAGIRQWATYFGGPSDDFIDGIAIDSNANILVLGYTRSSSGIATNGAYKTVLNGGADYFLAKFDNMGSLSWATYFGGETDEANPTTSTGVATDKLKNIYITVTTSSTTGIATTGAYQTALNGSLDAVLAKFTSNGSILWSTYFGGPGGESSIALAVDGSSSPIIVGATTSTSGLATSGAYQTTYGGGSYDGYIAKFSSSGNILWASYYGGPATDNTLSVTVDDSNYIYIAGGTQSTSGIATSGSYKSTSQGNDDSYIVKFDSTGARKWATYYGGPGNEDNQFAIHTDGVEIIIGGQTSSSSGIATPDAYQTTKGSNIDAYIAKFNVAGSLIWSSYYGGGGTDYISGAAFDHALNPIFCGTTTSSNNIATSSSQQSTYGGSEDIFVVKFCDPITPTLRATHDTVCLGTFDSIFLNTNYNTVRWYDGSTHLTSLDDSIRFIRCDTLSPGLHKITVTVTNTDNCDGTSDTIFLLVHPSPIVDAGRDTIVCGGTPVTLLPTVTSGTKPYQYYWTPSTGLSNYTIKNPSASPTVTTKYYLFVTDSNGCQGEDSILVSVYPRPRINPVHVVSICAGDTITIGDSARGGTSPYSYSWLPGSAINSLIVAMPKVFPPITTTYYEYVADAHGCDAYDSVKVIVNPLPHPNILPFGNVSLCGTDTITLHAEEGYLAYQWNTGATTDSILVITPGKYIVRVQDVQGCYGTSDTVIVTQRPLPSVVISGPNAVCPNSTTKYSVPSTSGEKYLWNLTGGGTITGGANTKAVTINWTTTGNWVLTIRDTSSFGCVNDTSITVNVNSTLTPTVTPAGPITVCNGDTVILRAAKGYVNYQWSDSSKADSLIVTKSGSYTVTVTAPGGCQGTSKQVQVTVRANQKPRPILQPSNITLCDVDTATLSPTQLFATYHWSTGATTSSINVTKAGTYYVQVVDSAGCDGISNLVTVSVNPKPTVSIVANGPLTFCEGDSVTLTAKGSGTKYHWSTDDSSASIVVRNSGTYSVTTSNSNGCTATSSLTVVVNPLPHLSINGPISVCPNESSDYSVPSIPGGGYSWSLIPSTLGVVTSTSNSVAIQWGPTLGQATLTVSVTTAEGCIEMDSLVITINSTLTPVVTASGPLSFCEGDSVTLDAGSGYLTYQWFLDGNKISGGINQTLRVGNSGSYTVFVVNAAGCSGTSNPVKILVHPVPKPIITSNGLGLLTGSFSTYQWNLGGVSIAGATSRSFTPSASGTYTVTVTDSNGCTNTSSPFGFGLNATAIVAIGPVNSVNPGEDVGIPLMILNGTNIVESGARHYIGVVRFNNSMLISRGTTPIGSVVANERLITVTGDTALAMGTLQTMDFIAALGTDSCTTVTLDTFYWTDAAVNVTLQNGAFCETGICNAGGHIRLVDPSGVVTLGQSHPNPASQVVHIDFNVSEKGTTRLFLSDLLGKRVMNLVDKELTPGSYSISVDISGLSSGSYLYSMQTPTLILTKVMLVTH